MIKQERVWTGSDSPNESGDIVNVVRETGDYSIFRLSKFNRNVIFRKEMLKQAEEGIISPIIVNEKMIVIDGQNRLLHSKEAGVPVEYIIKKGLTEDDIVRMNTIQKPWSLTNYIEAFANQGLNEYAKLIDLINQKLSSVTNTIQFAIDYPTATQMASEVIKTGDFQFYNYDKTLEFLHYSERFRKHTKTPKRARVESALYELFRLKEIDQNRVIDKVIQTGIADEIKIKDPKHTEALKMLLDAYNQKLNVESNKFISYYITSHGTILIDRDRQDWTRKKTAVSAVE